MKSLIKILAIVVMVISVSSCEENSRPNYQYFPNMYESVGYETYGSYEIFPNDQAALIPAQGTIARGYALFEFDGTTEGYNLAKTTLKSSLDSSEVDLAKGKELYNIYCNICHGNTGDGQGKLVKGEKILGIPNYADRDITEGSIYHVIYYGKNAMGSHANQLSESERWQVVAYVLKLKADL